MRLHLHLVSDSTGETVTTVARAGVSQFDGVVPVEHVWSFVRTRAQAAADSPDVAVGWMREHRVIPTSRSVPPPLHLL